LLQRLLESVIPANLSAYYDAIAGRSERGFQRTSGYIHPHQVARFKRVLEIVRGYAPATIIEAGCADGMMTAQLAEIARWVWAFDISPAMIAACPVLPNVHYEMLDVEGAPFADDVDLIVCCEVLEHVRHPQCVVRRICERASVAVFTAPVTEPSNPDAFNLGLYRCEQKAGDASGHIWAWDMDGFLSLFAGQNVVLAEQVGVSGLVVVQCAQEG